MFNFNPSIILAFLSFVLGIISLSIDPKDIKEPKKRSIAFYLFSFVLFLIFVVSIKSIRESDTQAGNYEKIINEIDNVTKDINNVTKENQEKLSAISTQITSFNKLNLDKTSSESDRKEIRTTSSNALNSIQKPIILSGDKVSKGERNLIVFSTDPELTIDNPVSAEWEVKIAKDKVSKEALVMKINGGLFSTGILYENETEAKDNLDLIKTKLNRSSAFLTSSDQFCQKHGEGEPKSFGENNMYKYKLYTCNN